LAGVVVVCAALANAFAGPPVSFIVTVLGPAGETTASRTAASFTEARHAEQARVWGRPKNWRWYF
jgi:predicted dienelactone hydrolase